MGIFVEAEMCIRDSTYPIIFINRIFIEISHSYNLIPIILSPTVDISEIEQMANMIDFLIPVSYTHLSSRILRKPEPRFSI